MRQKIKRSFINNFQFPVPMPQITPKNPRTGLTAAEQFYAYVVVPHFNERTAGQFEQPFEHREEGVEGIDYLAELNMIDGAPPVDEPDTEDGRDLDNPFDDFEIPFVSRGGKEKVSTNDRYGKRPRYRRTTTPSPNRSGNGLEYDRACAAGDLTTLGSITTHPEFKGSPVDVSQLVGQLMTLSPSKRKI